MRKLVKEDKNFLISQIAIIILSVLRVSKWEKVEHAARLLIFDDYNLSIIMTLVMCIAMFVMYLVLLKNISDKSKNIAFYTIMLISVTLYPTYVHDNYLGAMDIYGLIMGAICLIFIIINRLEWINIIMMTIAVFINPMCIFSIGIVVPLVILYKGFVRKDKKELVICICVALFELISFFASRVMGMFRIDAQQIIDLRKFIGILVFLIPFIVISVIMYYQLVKQSSGAESKYYYVISAFAGVPGFIIWAASGDYTRAFVNLFICYGLWLLVMLSYDDKLLVFQIKEQCKVIKKWVPINAVVVIYVAAIMLYWICGVEEFDTEKLLELVMK